MMNIRTTENRVKSSEAVREHKAITARQEAKIRIVPDKIHMPYNHK